MIPNLWFIGGVNSPGEMTTGGLLIKNDLDPFFRISYTARIHHGGLTYNSSLTRYVTGIPSFNSTPRPFAFTNEYRELVAVMNVYLSFEAAEYFHVRKQVINVRCSTCGLNNRYSKKFIGWLTDSWFRALCIKASREEGSI